MPGATLPADQGAALARVIARVERLERMTSLPRLGSIQSAAGDLARLHAFSNGTSTGYLGGSLTTLSLDQLDTDWTQGSDIVTEVSGGNYRGRINTDGVYSVTAIFDMVSNFTSQSYDTAYGVITTGGGTSLSRDPDVQCRPVHGVTINHSYAEFTIRFTGYLAASTTLTVKGMLRSSTQAALASWDFGYGDIFVQRLA